MFRELFFIVFIVNIRTSSCVIEALYEAGQQVWELYTIIDNRRLDTSHDAEAIEHLSDNPIIRELIKKVDEIHESLNELEELTSPKTIMDATKSWPLNGLLIWKIDTIQLFIENIDECYKTYHQYRNESRISYASFQILIGEIFQSLEDNIGIIREIASNGKKSQLNGEDLVATIAGFTRARSAEICGAPQIISNVLIKLFRMIIIAELKTNTMLAYENIYKYVLNKDKHLRQESNSLARDKFEKQFAIYINVFSSNMAVIDVVYNRACDPPGGHWIRDESFYELEKNIQPILFGYDLNKCKYETCGNVTNQKIKQCQLMFYDKSDGANPENTIGECADLGRIIACLLNSGPHRFQYVDSVKLGFLGRNNACPGDHGQLFDIGITKPAPSVTCACNSYSSQNGISLLMIESNVESNQVITGLRFLRKNKILYIQPRQGKLGPNGCIKKYSQRWMDIPENEKSSAIEPINRGNRVFFLDDLILPSKSILTGVKFNKVTREHVTGFAIEISGRLFDFRSGKLISASTFKLSQQELNGVSGNRLSFKRVSSVFTTNTHTVTSSDKQYVILESSRLEEDFGQSTLPLFDAIPMTIEAPSALGGVGIFHKGANGYAGLISLKVYGIQYGERFNDFKLSHMINDRVLFNSSFH